MKSAYIVLKEQFNNFYLIRRLALYNIKSKNQNTYLGILWEFIKPSIQILIYWFVFGTLRHRQPVELGGEEIQFFSWLLAAYFMWNFFSQATIQGSSSIYSKLKMLSKMNFPLSVIPGYFIFSRVLIHLIMVVIAIIIMQFSGYYVNIYYLQFVYFLFAAYCLVFALALITSTISTVVRDFHMFLTSTLRMFVYISGILWPLSRLTDVFPAVLPYLKLNPLIYLIEGYRSAFFGTEWYFVSHLKYTAYFWGLVVVLFLIGAFLHVKFRKRLIDFL